MVEENTYYIMSGSVIAQGDRFMLYNSIRPSMIELM